MRLIDGLELRQAGVADVEAILSLVGQSELAENGEIETDRSHVEAALGDPSTAAWSLVDTAGLHRVCGWLEPTPTGRAQVAELFVAPGTAADLARPVLARLIERQRDDPRGRPLHLFVSAHAAAMADFLASSGSTIVRHYLKMSVALTAPITSVEWPESVSLHRIRDSDEDLRPVHDVMAEAFADHWDHAPSTFDEWKTRQRRDPSFDPSLWWLVRSAGRPAAAVACTARENGSGVIGAVGVRRRYRGEGFARRLLLTAFGEFARRGLEKAELFVDAMNLTGAVKLYESVGMTVAARWDIHELPTTTARAQ